ncbi:MAG TPA: metalloregulator ArsR/SmtB family transcription factor [Candidatus Dormibacteraeota bacterium]|nr:metalloregulator ArsR/SmtB family transcription factor [Candidatus Dormibacteraeota bacterium]
MITDARHGSLPGVVPDALLEEVARRFALLGDPTRLRLLRALHEAGETPAGELAARAGVGRENASKHLARLAEAGLVTRRRQGATVLYRIADQSLLQMCELVCGSVRERAAALAGER